ncbi:OB-fold nucleic acid binding domain-containing protein, partial [Caulobacter sp. 17J65-9]|uniref:OB-fold nucleic acid binding domain-containing protein n=1 Tax=Caulobacter sp. 17J65-9 TaxID=2709382 RepID=UPI0013C65EEE|nr:error-prone DNA polymerase [Caulobacter sp. 17J65-9]
LVAARDAGAASPDAFAAAGVPRKALELLAEADAFRSLGLDRRQALWAVKGLDAPGAPLARLGARAEVQPMLPLMALPEHVVEDYRTTELSLKAHPVGFFREALRAKGVVPAQALRTMKNGRKAAVAGLVLVRQRPGTAKGVTFLTLEDETGAANVVVWRDRFEANRKTVMTSAFLLVRGKLQVEGDVIHLVADAFVDLSPRLRRLRQDAAGDPAAGMRSRDFH